MEKLNTRFLSGYTDEHMLRLCYVFFGCSTNTDRLYENFGWRHSNAYPHLLGRWKELT